MVAEIGRQKAETGTRGTSAWHDSPADEGDRRLKIVQALHRCVREQGYARTSLTDISVRAGMSPSHIRYYFDGKEAILRFYFEMLCRDLMSEIRKIPFDTPEQWLRDFSRFYIGNPRISQAGLSVIVEIFGIAMHDEQMKQLKLTFDENMRTLLRAFFERAGCAPGLTPSSAAELTRAIDVGLKYSTAFSETSTKDLEEIFLAGIGRLIASPKNREINST